jgi:hypothetical protein
VASRMRNAAKAVKAPRSGPMATRLPPRTMRAVQAVHGPGVANTPS